MNLGSLVSHTVTAVFLAAAIVVVGFVGVWGERVSARSSPATTVGIAWILFVVFKEGFVRQDPEHVEIGLLGLATAALVVAPTVGAALSARDRVAAPLTLVAVALTAWWIASDRLPALAEPASVRSDTSRQRPTRSRRSSSTGARRAPASRRLERRPSRRAFANAFPSRGSRAPRTRTRTTRSS